MMTKKKGVVQKENIDNRTKGNIDTSKKYHIDYGTQTSDTPQWQLRWQLHHPLRRSIAVHF